MCVVRARAPKMHLLSVCVYFDCFLHGAFCCSRHHPAHGAHTVKFFGIWRTNSYARCVVSAHNETNRGAPRRRRQRFVDAYTDGHVYRALTLSLSFLVCAAQFVVWLGRLASKVIVIMFALNDIDGGNRGGCLRLAQVEWSARRVPTGLAILFSDLLKYICGTIRRCVQTSSYSAQSAALHKTLRHTAHTASLSCLRLWQRFSSGSSDVDGDGVTACETMGQTLCTGIATRAF